MNNPLANPKKDVNAWEDKTPATMTEREKRDFTRSRIESETEGNPHMRPYKKEKKIKFKPPTKEIEARMKLLDHMGNPIKGYKWGKFNKKKLWFEIVKDTIKIKPTLTPFNPFNVVKQLGS